MKNIYASIFAALVAAVSAGAWSADNLAEKEGAELRQRAQEFQNERARNPEFQPGEGRSAPEPARAATKKKRSKPAVKTDAKAAETKEPMKDKARRKARSLKNIPGAFVRR